MSWHELTVGLLPPRYVNDTFYCSLSPRIGNSTSRDTPPPILGANPQRINPPLPTIEPNVQPVGPIAPIIPPSFPPAVVRAALPPAVIRPALAPAIIPPAVMAAALPQAAGAGMARNVLVGLGSSQTNLASSSNIMFRLDAIGIMGPTYLTLSKQGLAHYFEQAKLAELT